MEVLALTTIMLILTDVTGTNDQRQDWTVDVTKMINVTLSSNVTIHCNYSYPGNQNSGANQVYWRLLEHPGHLNDDYIYHPNESFVKQEFQGRTKLIGGSSERNCTLNIQNVISNVGPIYLRISTKLNNFSFVRDLVYIHVDGSIPSYPTENTQESFTQNDPIDVAAPEIYIPASIVSVVVLLFFGILGIVFFKRIKRPQSVTREESGYYVNFSRTPYQNERDTVSNINVTKNPVSPAKIIDDPVYGNVKGPIDQINSINQTDNIYANVDYSKCPKSHT